MLNLQLLGRYDGPFDFIKGQLELKAVSMEDGRSWNVPHLQLSDAIHVNNNSNVCVFGCPSLFKDGRDLQGTLKRVINKVGEARTSPR
jgi:hypothetical protein